jgi:hypothetical protein
MARRYRDYSSGSRRLSLTSLVNRPAENSDNNALLWGIAWLIITAILGWFFRVMPTSSFGAITTGYVSLLNHVIVNLVVWITACALPFLVAVVVNRKTKVTELFGRMLFAHWPVIILMLPAVFGDKIAYSTYMNSVAHFDFDVTFTCEPSYSLWMTILLLVTLVWYLYWSYLAFRRATNRSGITIFVYLVVAMMLSWWLSDVVVESMIPSLIK